MVGTSLNNCIGSIQNTVVLVVICERERETEEQVEGRL